MTERCNPWTPYSFFYIFHSYKCLLYPHLKWIEQPSFSLLKMRNKSKVKEEACVILETSSFFPLHCEWMQTGWRSSSYMCVVVSMSNIEAQTWLPFFVFAKQGNFKIRSSCAWLMVRSFYELDRLCLSQSQGIFDEGGSIRYWGSASVCGLNLQEKQPEPIWSDTLTLCNMQRQSMACWGRKDGIVLISIPAGTPSGLIGFLYLVFSN